MNKELYFKKGDENIAKDPTVRLKMSIARKGRKWIDLYGKNKANILKKQMSLRKKGHKYNVGKKISDETKEKMRKAKIKWLKNNIPWNKDIPWTENRRNAQPPKKPIIKDKKIYDPYWDEIRKSIFKRDNYICRECNCRCSGKNHKDTKKLIQCHHIDYDTKNNNSDNLITLCASCHAKTNFNKNNWIRYYKNKLMEILF